MLAQLLSARHPPLLCSGIRWVWDALGLSYRTLLNLSLQADPSGHEHTIQSVSPTLLSTLPQLQTLGTSIPNSLTNPGVPGAITKDRNWGCIQNFADAISSPDPGDYSMLTVLAFLFRV